MNDTVIIPTVGLGFRLGQYTSKINKALLPFGDRPILSHIIELFPNDTHFLIPVGYLAQQVIDFCTLAYHDRDITFVHVDDWTSKKSGTAYSLLHCKPHIVGPFWYIPCDTYMDKAPLVPEEDCYFIKTVTGELADRYTTFEVTDDRIDRVHFKEPIADSMVSAYSGVAFISKWQEFFERLENLDGIEFIHIIEAGTLVKELPSWLDIGSLDLYENIMLTRQKFDFSKPNELTYICNDRVIKWWLDESIAKKKYEKILANLSVYPDNCKYQNNWLAYDFFPGKTMYQHGDPNSFPNLLSWLHEKVWIRGDSDISDHSLKFYRDKSISRIDQFRTSHPDRILAPVVNGVKVDESIIDQIDWDLLIDTNLPGLMHGDLQFDNIIIDSAGNFTLIDWRHEFAGLVDSGDIYYDLAKLAGGLLINYSLIKQNSFSVRISDDDVIIDVPSVEHLERYQLSLVKYIKDNGLDHRKVQLLIPIIFLNMSPLHAAPFDLLLWYLGLKMLHETIL